MAISAKRIGKPAADRGGKLSPAGTMVALLMVTVAAIAAGALFGLQVQVLVERSLKPSDEATEIEPADIKPVLPEAAAIRNLPPVVTTLDGPQRDWVRIEASIVLAGEPSAGDDLLAAKIAEDIVAFMQTVSAADIEGASGFQHLREDLIDRARVRSDGRVRDLVVHTFIVE